MIEREDRDRVAILRIAHGKANALDVELARDIEQALDDVEQSDARVAILTGTGRIFSAGVDLLRILDGGADYVAEFLPALDSCCERLFFFPKPIIAAVNGHAIAGGCVFTCACDYRLAAAGKALIGVPELLVGVPFPTMPLAVLRFAVPAERFQEIVYLGQNYSVDDARLRGLVDEVVAADELIDRAVAVAGRLAELPPASLESTKRLVRQPVRDFITAHRERIDGEVLEIWKAPVTHDAIREFVRRTFRSEA